MRTLLHVGCGPQNSNSIKGFNNPEWEEIRLDIDPDMKPDVLGTLTDMNGVSRRSVDAVYSSHNIEHIFHHEVPIALSEFYRVLRKDSFVVITCPDLQAAAERVAKDQLLDPLYNSPAGPITPMDVLFGHGKAIAGGRIHMGHRCGFTYTTLSNSFREAGFDSVFGGRRMEGFDLWLIASKAKISDTQLRSMAKMYFP